MTYSRSGDQVTVEFSFDEFSNLLAILGFALMTAEKLKKHPHIAQDISRFIDELNRTNPDALLYAMLPPSAADPSVP